LTPALEFWREEGQITVMPIATVTKKRRAVRSPWLRLQPRLPDLTRRYTYDELCAVMDETNLPHELWDGELIMSPPPNYAHQKLVFALARELHAFVTPRDLGEVIISPFDMVLSPRRAFQPDVLFVAKARLPLLQTVLRGPADLVAEVVSDSGRRRDRIDKRDIYAQHGIPEYWIVDPEARSVDVLTLEKGEYRLAGRAGVGETARSVLLKGFALDVGKLFGG
jgi:Uma2 family endonuclease